MRIAGLFVVLSLFSLVCYLLQPILVYLLLFLIGPPKPVDDATWDFSKERSEEVVAWPKYAQSYPMINSRFRKLTLILPGGKSEMFPNVSASAWKTGCEIDDLDIMFPGESVKSVQAHAREVMHQWELDSDSTEASLQKWATKMSTPNPWKFNDRDWEGPFSKEDTHPIMKLEIKYGAGDPTPWHLDVSVYLSTPKEGLQR